MAKGICSFQEHIPSQSGLDCPSCFPWSTTASSCTASTRQFFRSSKPGLQTPSRSTEIQTLCWNDLVTQQLGGTRWDTFQDILLLSSLQHHSFHRSCPLYRSTVRYYSERHISSSVPRCICHLHPQIRCILSNIQQQVPLKAADYYPDTKIWNPEHKCYIWTKPQ